MIGIDIGGTHTDGVFIKNGKLIGQIKTPTTANLEEGFKKVIHTLKSYGQINAIFLGTTHATNALLEGEGLNRVGVLRIAGQKPFIPPFFKWPKHLKDKIYAGSETLSGGYECDGRPHSPFDINEARSMIHKLEDQGAESLAVTGLFASLQSDQEEMIKTLTDLPLTLSHEIGGLNFLDRENGAILNSSLISVLKKGFGNLKKILKEEGVHAPLFISKNNGSLMTVEEAIHFPILTLSAGCTNSFIGASELTGCKEGIIVDIGGTSTDIGALKNGFPRRSLHQKEIGGVRLNFQMPDVISLAIGGGSRLDGLPSVARKLKTEASAFGGNIATLTCAAIKLGYEIEGASTHHIPLTKERAKKHLNLFGEKIRQASEKMRGLNYKLPILLAGGAAPLLHPFIKEASLIPNSGVVNAFGAAFGKIEGSIDEIVTLQDRENTLNNLIEKAKVIALKEGARKDSLEIIEKEIIPYPYLPGFLSRVRITVAGSHNYL